MAFNIPTQKIALFEDAIINMCTFNFSWLYYAIYHFTTTSKACLLKIISAANLISDVNQGKNYTAHINECSFDIKLNKIPLEKLNLNLYKFNILKSNLSTFI